MLITYHFGIDVEVVEHPFTWLPLDWNLPNYGRYNPWDKNKVHCKAGCYPQISTFGMPKMGTMPYNEPDTVAERDVSSQKRSFTGPDEGLTKKQLMLLSR